MSLTLNDLMEEQICFDKDNTEITEGFEMVRHTSLHLSKLVGKLAEYCETREHSNVDKYSDELKVTNEVIPDLLVYALQLSKNFDVDLQRNYLARLSSNKGKVIFDNS